MIEHMVFAKVRADITEAQIAEVMQALAASKGVIPGLTRFVGGANVSPEGLSRGFTHAFIVTFESAAARDGYLPHPAHVAAAKKLLRITEGAANGVMVIDIEV